MMKRAQVNVSASFDRQNKTSDAFDSSVKSIAFDKPDVFRFADAVKIRFLESAANLIFFAHKLNRFSDLLLGFLESVSFSCYLCHTSK